MKKDFVQIIKKSLSSQNDTPPFVKKATSPFEAVTKG